MMDNILEVQNLKKYFTTPKGTLHAVDDVSFTMKRGTTLGVVGESGCGKSTLGRTVLHLLESTGGKIIFEGEDVTNVDKKKLRELREKMQIIFQDPYSSLNPRMTVRRLIAEPLLEHKLVSSKAECDERVKEFLHTVGLSSRDIEKYPHEFSGGQRQRIMIARALAVSPKVVVCDEPVSALDVSVQAQILNLMQDLQEKTGVSYLFIAHGMPVVQHISHRVGVMYLGKLVEVATSEEIFDNCLHPYTQALMGAIPNPDPAARARRAIVKGEVPSLLNPPQGCLFASRCPYCTDKCRKEAPVLREAAPGHQVACHII